MSDESQKPSSGDIHPLSPMDQLAIIGKERVIHDALQTGYSELRTWDDGIATDRNPGMLAVYQTGVREHYRRIGVYDDDIVRSPLNACNFGPERFIRGWNKEQFDTWLNSQGMHEALVVARSKKYEKRTRVVGYKGLFKKPVVEEYFEVVGQNTVRELVGNGPEEPAVIVSYRATARYDESLHPSVRYRGRPGNSLDLQIIIPESIASQITEMVEKDPPFIREVVEAFVTGKYPQKFIDGNWQICGRPLYEAWDSQPESKMYYSNLTKPNTPEQQNWKILQMKPTSS